MRLIVIPLNSSRSFLYCQFQKTDIRVSLLDRATARAARFWESWSSSETRWKKRITQTGQKMLDNIDYEEVLLKQIPSSLVLQRDPIPLLHPSFSRPETILLELDSRRPLHMKWLFVSLAVLPLTLPLALVPLIPNVPGFYATYRAWSHYKAIDGIKTLKLLREQQRLEHRRCCELDRIYGESGLLDNWQLSGKQMEQLAHQFKAPGLILGLQQAIRQINKS